MSQHKALLRALRDEEEGATMVEYALMIALIALVCVGAASALGVNVRDVFADPTLTTAL
jgi:pilus assembly protein Flp/PilA